MKDVDLKVFIGMNRTLNAMHKASDKIFRQHGLTRGQFAVLEALYHKGVLSVGEVQELILTTSGNLPVIVNNLEKEKLLSRCRDEEDRRKISLSITDEGKALMEEVMPKNKKLLRQMMKVWSREEQETLLRAFQKFRDHRKE